MNPNNKFSGLKAFFEGFLMIWSPAEKALRLRRELNARSLEETIAAAQRTGHEVSFVNLPHRVSGFAAIIDGNRHIVLNRAKSRPNLEYTLLHELGHHVLHLSAWEGPDSQALPDIGTAEFQADLFAATWVIGLGNNAQSNEILAENPEASATIAACLMLTLVLMVMTILFSVFSKVFPDNRNLLPKAR